MNEQKIRRKLAYFREGLPLVNEPLVVGDKLVNDYGALLEVFSIEDGSVDMVTIMPASAAFWDEAGYNENVQALASKGTIEEEIPYREDGKIDLLRNPDLFKLYNGLVTRYMETGGKVSY